MSAIDLRHLLSLGITTGMLILAAGSAEKPADKARDRAQKRAEQAEAEIGRRHRLPGPAACFLAQQFRLIRGRQYFAKNLR